MILGVVYVYGALIKATQFHGASQSITDTLPLVPLEQILLAGINASLFLIAAAIFGVLIVLFIREIEERRASKASSENRGAQTDENEGKARDQVSQPNWFQRHLFLILNSVSVLCALFIVLTSPPSMIVIVVYFAILLWWRWPPKISRKRWALVGAVLFVCVTLAQNYVSPKPLPKVVITTMDGSKVEGDLLVNTNSAWYVGIGDREFKVVQSARIDIAKIEAQERDDTTVFEKLTGEKFLGLPRE